jgi:uncharacterized protein YwgA
LSNKEILANFLKALEDAGIIDFDKNRFTHRLKLQKYVFIAQKLGFRTNYGYSLYLRGPYSPSLASDYYSISNFKDKKPVILRRRFVNLVKNKSEEWLELAATILMIRGRYKNTDHDTLISLVMTVKPFAKREDLLKIIRNLERHNCLD